MYAYLDALSCDIGSTRLANNKKTAPPILSCFEQAALRQFPKQRMRDT